MHAIYTMGGSVHSSFYDEAPLRKRLALDLALIVVSPILLVLWVVGFMLAFATCFMGMTVIGPIIAWGSGDWTTTQMSFFIAAEVIWCVAAFSSFEWLDGRGLRQRIEKMGLTSWAFIALAVIAYNRSI